jgi:hypothetical protein
MECAAVGERYSLCTLCVAEHPSHNIIQVSDTASVSESAFLLPPFAAVLSCNSQRILYLPPLAAVASLSRRMAV